RPSRPFLDHTLQKKEQTMKTKTFLSLSLAGLAVSVFAVSMPALAHDGYFYGHGRYGRPHFVYPGQRVVIVRPPVFVPRPVFVYRPAPVYYAPAPVYYTAPAPVFYPPAPVYYSAPEPVYYPQPAWATIGGAIAGAAIGSAVGDG